MKRFKNYINEDIDPFEEDDWDWGEGISQFFDDKETGLELEWNPTKKTMKGWIVRNIENPKISDYINKYFNRKITSKDEILLCTRYIV